MAELRLLTATASMVTVFSATGHASAQTDEQKYESRVISDKFHVTLGGLVSDFQTDIAAGSGLGAVIRLEDVLGFDEDLSTVTIQGFYRLGDTNKHALGFGLTQFERDASGSITGTVPIFDEDFTGDFQSDFDVDTLSLMYRYSFVNTGKTEAGFVVGLSTYNFEFALDGTVQVSGPGGPTLEARTEQAEFLAPLPTVGFFVSFAIKPKLILHMSADTLDLDVGDTSGRVLNTQASFTWFVSKPVGVGLRIGSTELSYENDDQGEIFKVDYQVNGTAVFLAFGF